MGQFLKQTFASFIGTLAAIAILATVGVGGLFFLILSLTLGESSSPVEDKSFLVLDLSTSIQDTQPSLTLSQALSGEQVNVITLRNLLTTLDKASQDNRIVGIFLDGRKTSIGNGYGTLEEIYQALERFKASGKKIIAYDVDIDEKEYYLTSLADQIILNPMGSMEFNGLGAEQIFFNGAMEKYGIGIQVVRVGNFKGAVEPYTRPDFSQDNREQLQDLLSHIWDTFIDKVSKNREIDSTKLQNIAKTQGIITAEQAKASGFIDQIGYLDEAIAELRKISGEPQSENGSKNSFRQISVKNYLDWVVKETTSLTATPKIAVVYVEGAIVNTPAGLNTVSGEKLAQILRQIRQDETIKAVILRINSPGGSATASDIILREVQLTNEKKPVVVSMGNVAASGGYWIATGGQYIFAQPNTITGSIGVFGLLFNYQELANNNGLTWDRVQTSPLANISSATRPKTPQELAIFQRSVDQVYDVFLQRVAQSRNLSVDQVNNIGQGRVWSGKEAQKIGLVDEMGGIESAIAHTVELAKLGKDWEIVEYPENQSFETLLLQRLSGTEVNSQIDPLTREWLRIREELAIFSTLDDPQGVYTRLPFSWQVD